MWADFFYSRIQFRSGFTVLFSRNFYMGCKIVTFITNKNFKHFGQQKLFFKTIKRSYILSQENIFLHLLLKSKELLSYTFRIHFCSKIHNCWQVFLLRYCINKRCLTLFERDRRFIWIYYEGICSEIRNVLLQRKIEKKERNIVSSHDKTLITRDASSASKMTDCYH